MASERNQSRRRYVRAKILLDHLHEMSRHSQVDKVLVDHLTFGSVVSRSCKASTADNETSNDEDELLPGGLTNTDFRRFASLRRHLDAATQDRLAEALDSTLLSIAEFYWGERDLSEDERFEKAWNLPEEIAAHRDSLQKEQADARNCKDRISQLTHDIGEIHPRLQEHLVHALTTFPPLLSNTRSASSKLFTATIEASLVKLSLFHARAHLSLYGYKSPTNPDITMTRALSVMHDNLTSKEQRLFEDERALDRELGEYQRLVSLVDGPGGGFAQVVEDWTRVQRETEECRRDLRRLGWTGD